MKGSILFLLVAATLTSVSCCSCRHTAKLQKPLEGTVWQLVQIMARDVVPEGDSFTVQFSDNGEVTGMAACNRLMATYSATAERALNIENVSTTRMMCPDHAAETEFIDMLGRVTHYEMDADKMLLLSNGELVAIFQAK